MAKGLSYYLKQSWKKPCMEVLRKRMVIWRAGSVVEKVEKPLRLDRAHALGYKAKKGIIVVRVRIGRGGHIRPRPRKARMSRKMTIRKTLRMNYKEIAERKAARKYRNMEVLNSYWIGKDGINYFFEVILVDRSQPEIKSDKELGFISRSPRTRVFRGLTSAGKKSRGLRNSSVISPKVRPSLRAHGRRGT